MNFELSLGNEIDYVDHGDDGKLYGIYLQWPFHEKEMLAKKMRIPITIEILSSSENKFCAPEVYFLCNDTRQFLSAPQSEELIDLYPITKEVILK